MNEPKDSETTFDAAKEGPGIYGDMAAAVLRTTEAQMVVLMVGGGEEGSGFSVVTTDPRLRAHLPRLLRQMAQSIEKQQAAKTSEK